MNQFESLVFFIVYSACDKINASIALFKSLYGWNISFFSSILAQEELAKLILLPLLWEVGEVDKVVQGKSSVFFNHCIKQRVFTSFGLQNRSYKEIETLKQQAIYVGIDTSHKSNWKRITPFQAKEELQHAVQLLFYFGNKMLLSGDLSDKCKDVIKKSIFLTLGLVKKELSHVIKIDESMINKQVDIMKQRGKPIDSDGVKLIMSDPFAIISLFKFCFPKTYKMHLKNILQLDYDGLCSYCVKHISF